MGAESEGEQMRNTIPQKEEQKRLHLYHLGLYDYEIAELCGVTPPAIRTWRVRRGLPRVRRRDSWCWDCKNAYAHKCPWIGQMKPVWDKAKKEKKAQHTTYTVYSVQKCRHFEPEEKRQYATPV